MTRTLLAATLVFVVVGTWSACEKPKPTTQERRACADDSDCGVWPSGCCALEAMNEDYVPDEPHPGAACQMVCHWNPKRPVPECIEGQCVVEY